MKRFHKPVPKPFSFRLVHRRLWLVLVAYAFLMGLIFWKSFEIHLYPDDQEKLARQAKTQYQRKETLPAKRGAIYDRNGNELAVDEQVQSLGVNPRLIDDAKSFAAELAPLLEDLPADKIQSLIETARNVPSGEKPRPFLWIKRRLSSEETEKVRKLKVEGLEWRSEYKRTYPNHRLASTLLGAVGLDSKGLEGLELFHEDKLKVDQTQLVFRKDLEDYQDSQPLSEREPQSLVLTIDQNIQLIAEEELGKALRKTQVTSAIALVMKVDTGEILAMVTLPDFDPNDYTSAKTEYLKNRTILDSFEPGSIFKAITVAAALESGRVSLGQKFNCEGGAIKVGKYEINDHGRYGMMGFPDIIRVSSNIGSYKIAQFLGPKVFGPKVFEFGFGAKTGIDLPGESPGILLPYSEWSSLRMGTIAYGQGISVTPIQIVTAYSAIANGGSLLKPFVVKQVLSANRKVVQETSMQEVRRVMKPENAKILREWLQLVVGPGGTGTAAQIPEYGVAGKTGTAQKVVEGRKGYSDRYVASFVGFAPADDPKITVLVSINEPKGEHSGGVVAAPVFREITRRILMHLQVPPKTGFMPVMAAEAEPLVPQKPAQQQRQNTDQAQNKSRNSKNVVLPKPPTKPESKLEVPVALTEAGNDLYVLPSYLGKTRREIYRSWDDSKLKLVIEGSGQCFEQIPAPGKTVKKGSEIKLIFKSS